MTGVPSNPDTPAAGRHGDTGQSLAVWAESLYLANLLLAPGLAFGVLLGMFALSKALAGQAWRYPLIGPRLH